MSLNAKNLARIAHANGNNVFLYKTADAIASVTGSNYFNGASQEFFQHDVIIVVSSTGGTVAIDVLVVTSADRAATVTVTNGT